VFLALVAQQAKRMSRIIFSSVASPAVQIFFINYIINDRIFWKKEITENKIRVLIFSKLLSEIFLILRITDRDILRNTKTPSFLSNFKQI
jgi:hypothetical protein